MRFARKLARRQRVGTQGPAVELPAQRASAVAAVLPGVSEYAAQLVRDGIELDDCVIIAADPRRRDVREHFSRTDSGRAVLSEAMVELDDDRASFLITAAPKASAQKMIAKSSPAAAKRMDEPLPAGKAWLVAMFEGRMQVAAIDVAGAARS